MIGMALFSRGTRRRACRLGSALILAAGVWASSNANTALAAGEAHPLAGEFGSFSNPNGIAVDEASGDVYVADIGTKTVDKFDGSGSPVDFAALGGNELTGAETPAGSFSFPEAYGTPAAIAVDNACAQHTPALSGRACEAFDPSAGDLYVMDAGDGVIDKFDAEGKYLNQMSGFGGELLGLGVDGSGTLHVDLAASHPLVIDEFDDAAVNDLVARQVLENENQVAGDWGMPGEPEARGFAVSATGDDYQTFEPSCACTAKVGQLLSPLGSVDGDEAGDVAIATDPATGELYADDQSSVAEWDTGAMNRNSPEIKSAGTLVTRFGSPELSGSSGRGGIAVNGETGDIYVANPENGKVYVFGSDAPAVTVNKPAGVSRDTASLSGTVDPRGVAVSECEFEYGLTDEFGSGPYNHSVPCKQTPAQIDGGSGAVAVSAQLEGLEAGELYHFRLVATNADGMGQASGMLPTQGVGFGIKSYEISFVNENGTPDTQAGSHPYKFVDLFTLNSHFKRQESNADSPYIRLPDGVLRNVKIDLPPGFVGDPNAPTAHCTGQQLELEFATGDCPTGSFVGRLHLAWSANQQRQTFLEDSLFAMAPVHGVALQLGTNFFLPLLYINNGLLAGGDYPVQTTVTEAPTSAPVIGSRAELFGLLEPCTELPEGTTGKYEPGCQETSPTGRFERGSEPGKALLTMPTGCHGPLRSTMEADSWEEPDNWATKSAETRNAAGTPVSLAGCSKLKFLPEISATPDSDDASTSSGLAVNVHVPQTAALNPSGLAESSLRDTTVTLPEGVAINPSGGDGLEACTSDAGALGAGTLGSPGDQIGYLGQEELNEYEPGVTWNTFTPEVPNPEEPGVNFCADGSKIGTVKIKTPLLEHELEGAVYLASQNSNPFGSLIAMYLVAEDPFSGSLIKLAGEVSLTESGQIVTTFKNTPDLPFENLELHFFGGERAPLTTPSRCGVYTTTAVFTPWDGNGPVASESSFEIEHGPHGGPCPGASLPFNPALHAGTTSNNAGNFSAFSTTIERQDGEQNMQAVSLHLPTGLSGVLSGVKLCPEAQANEGMCGPESLIGETTVAAGVGSDPVSVKGGKVYLTEKYDGAPFGLSIVNPVKAGPFDLEHDTSKPASNMPSCDCLVVRAKVEVNPVTAALTVTTDATGPHVIPHLIDGVPVQIQKVNVLINRPGFMFNPTSCEPLKITGSISSDEGALQPVSASFQGANCANLTFKPSFSASTRAKSSRKDGASLTVHLGFSNEAIGKNANVREVKVELPKQLPSELKTLQHACLAAQFNANPAGCPAESIVGHAKATTPILPVPIEGPAYFVSYGGAKFPELVLVLQGYGITIELHGETFINEKTGVTSSTFKTVPDQPVENFELTLPEQKYSALGAPGGKLCDKKLIMPLLMIGQNGAQLEKNIRIAVTGCPDRVSVLKHKLKGHTLMLRVSVPSAGKLTVHGKGVRKQTASSTGRETITIHTVLLGGGAHGKHGRHSKPVKAKVELSFDPAGKSGKKLAKALTLIVG